MKQPRKSFLIDVCSFFIWIYIQHYLHRCAPWLQSALRFHNYRSVKMCIKELHRLEHVSLDHYLIKCNSNRLAIELNGEKRDWLRQCEIKKGRKREFFAQVMHTNRHENGNVHNVAGALVRTHTHVKHTSQSINLKVIIIIVNTSVHWSK